MSWQVDRVGVRWEYIFEGMPKDRNGEKNEKLSRAITNDQEQEACRLLTKEFARPNHSDLVAACQKGMKEFIKLVVVPSFNIDYFDEEGRSVVTALLQEPPPNFVEIVTLLRQRVPFAKSAHNTLPFSQISEANFDLYLAATSEHFPRQKHQCPKQIERAFLLGDTEAILAFCGNREPRDDKELMTQMHYYRLALQSKYRYDDTSIVTHPVTPPTPDEQEKFHYYFLNYDM